MARSRKKSTTAMKGNDSSENKLNLEWYTAEGKKDKFTGSNKKLPAHIIQIIVLLIGVVIAVGVAVYFNGDKVSENQVSDNYQQFCGSYEKISNEISCDDAITLALQNYPGEVKSVDKKLLTYEEKRLTQTVWIIEIDNLSTPINLPFFVDANNPKISPNESSSNESKVVNRIHVYVDASTGEIGSRLI